MAALKVRNLWTVFIAAFVALLASVGLTTAAAAVRRSSAPKPAQPQQPGRAGEQTAESTAESTSEPTSESTAGRIAQRTDERAEGRTGRKRADGRASRVFVPAPSTRTGVRTSTRLTAKPAVRPSTRWVPTARDRSLPPTIKQRIGAEAHGACPAARQLPVLESDGADTGRSSSDSAPAPAAEPELAAAA
ncbi:DUF6344 domain-containing protein [Streptomyces sp. NPDC051907]|uniref:DUF6344 domain-containing protein n=1 Tax=Streptomyces sp. NPDC051907 TaxID=3155284 RepID=UPI0034493E53